LKVHDIVVGRYSVNLGSFITPHLQRGQGSNPLEWMPRDLLASESSVFTDPAAQNMRRFQADDQLLAVAESVTNKYEKGQVVVGVIGTAELWNNEIDFIEHLHSRYGTSVEEMETASAAQIASIFAVPFVGIRVVSDNITNQGSYDPKAGLACQEFVYHVVKAYIETMQKDRASVR
jgi:adenosylhomocysteine nucleosidase